jgi:outer membrane protein OmpA-like peptidoglycan-associated protein
MSKLIFALLFLVSLSKISYPQLPYNLQDARFSTNYCIDIERILLEKPREVLFGISINTDGEVILSVTNKEWFDKIFTYANGVTVDIVSKEFYDCNKIPKENSNWNKGFVLKPLYKQNFNANIIYSDEQSVSLKLGTLSASNFKGKELEANLVLLNGNQVCYYSNFINIARSNWTLLPMGFYTDSLINISTESENGHLNGFLWSKKIQSIVPFPKNQSSYNDVLLKNILDSIQKGNYSVKKIEIRAYSSIEGSPSINEKLMQMRADAMLLALKKYDPELKRTKVITAENWIEFFEVIKGTEFEYLADMPKVQIKQKLRDPIISAKLEPLLSRHRKAIIIVYLDAKPFYSNLKSNEVANEFNAAIRKKEIDKANGILNAVWEQISNRQLPEDYLNNLEIPFEETYALLINKKEIYKYLLSQTSAFEAIELLEQLQKMKPTDRRIKYNLCVLYLLALRANEEQISRDSLLNNIQQLESFDIHESLVKRLLINYHILQSNYHYYKGEYELKDKSVYFIRDVYFNIELSDDDVYALAKYFAFYSLFEWSEAIIKPRVDKLDVNEDILFYYINLCFYHPELYDSDDLKKAMLNAVNLNRIRYCYFFKPNDQGGASMQLLDHESFKSTYCDNCATGILY